MTSLKIERRGGFGGFGLPGSRVKSEGRIDLDQLGAADRKIVEGLFAAGGEVKEAPHPDGFTYRISRVTPAGEEVVEVHEGEVPAALTGAVRDELI
jgi:hypothetical protein